MPYETQDTGIDADGKKQLDEELDRLVASGQMTPEDAVQVAQTRGLTTGPGSNSYNPPTQAVDLNEQSRQSAARSAAYQASRVGNPEGYTKESQDEWDATHPLSDY